LLKDVEGKAAGITQQDEGTTPTPHIRQVLDAQLQIRKKTATIGLDSLDSSMSYD